MSYPIVALDAIQLPAHLMNRSAANDIFASGLPTGMGFPSIGIKGTRFAVKADGTETVLPSLEIAIVLLSARPTLDKTYYAGKFDPNSTEAKGPDCYSRDGLRPAADSPMKQSEVCATCPMNAFGSGMDQNGNPSKGKACADSKTLAIFANNGVYGFKIPPASLKAFSNYVKETSRRGVDLSTAITVVSFDVNFSYPVLTFGFGGFLGEAQIAKIDSLKTSPEVMDIIGGTAALITPAQAATPAPEILLDKPAAAPDPFASMEAGNAPAAAEKPKKVTPIKEIKAKTASQVQPGAAEDMTDEEKELAAALGLVL